MSSSASLPSPDNDYAAPLDAYLNKAFWDAAIVPISARIRALEAVKADWEELINTGTGQALAVIQANVEPQLVALNAVINQLKADVAAAEDAIAVIIGGGIAMASVTGLSAALALKASTLYVDDAIDALKGGVSSNFDTLVEIAAALAGKINVADLKSDGTPNAPAGFDVGGGLKAKTLRISGASNEQQRLEFWADGVLDWILYRDVDGSVALYQQEIGTAWRVDHATNKVNFTALPTVAGFSMLYLDGDGKLPAYDGSKLTNLPNVILQSGRVFFVAPTTLTAAIPMDATKPQIGEGTQVLSATITPKSATSKIRATFTCPSAALQGAGRAMAAMFVDGGADAVAVASAYTVSSGNVCLPMRHEFTSGSLAARTITVRMGPGGGASGIVVNSADGTNNMGGIFGTDLVIEEIRQ